MYAQQSCKRSSRILDSDLGNGDRIWVVFNPDGAVVASSNNAESRSKSLMDIISDFPVGVDLINNSDSATGKTIVRSVYVQP